MGVVYRARDETLEREVAIKVLPADKLADAEARQRFRREALALSRLNHPHIATIHAFDSTADLDYLVMEFVDGPTLREHMATAPLMEGEVLRIFERVAAAVGEAHEHDIIHRDLKPANIKLSGKGEVKVLDFGLATLQRPPAALSETMITRTLADAPRVAGTLPYMAPDQLRGRPPQPSTDVWSLGVMLYEAVAGARPFQGVTVHELSSSILNDPPAPLQPSISVQLRGVIDRCLHKDPQQRFHNAGELRVALQTLQSSPSIPLAAVPRRPARRWIPAVAAAGAAAVIVAAWFGWQAFHGPAGAGPGSAIRSVVAAPSTVVAGDQDGFLADAIPRTISNHLSLLDGLVTKAPPTARAYDEMGADPSRLAETYGVGAIVVSSVTARADRLVLNVQLVETGTQRLLWGSDFEGTRDSYLDLVSDASRGIRNALRPAAVDVAEPDLPRTSEAEFALQKGYYLLDLYFSQGSADDLGRAADRFRDAMERDPTHAAATAAFAQIQFLEIGHGADPAGAMDRAEMWARRAIQIDERCSRGWHVLSRVEGMRPDGNAGKSLEYALKAAAFGPLNHYAHISLAVTLAAISCELGAAAYLEGPRINPLDLNSSAAAAGLLYQVGRGSEALSLLDRVLGIEPDLAYPLLMKTMILIARGETDSAGELSRNLDSLTEGPFPPQALEMMRVFLELSRAVDRGDPASAAVNRVTKMARGEGLQFPYWERMTQVAAPFLSRSSHPAEALETLQARTRSGIVEPYDMLIWHPDLESVRHDPRFTPVLEAARTRFEELVSILEAARERGELPGYLDLALTDLMNRLPRPS